MRSFLVLLYFFLEVVVTIQIGGAIGGVTTFLMIIITALMGFWILRSFKAILGESLVGLMQGRKSAQQIMQSNVLTILGAIFLIVPGFLSDIIGLLMQISFVATLITNRLGIKESKGNEYYYSEQSSKQKYKGEDDVIDVEIIEHISTTK